MNGEARLELNVDLDPKIWKQYLLFRSNGFVSFANIGNVKKVTELNEEPTLVTEFPFYSIINFP